MARYAGITTNPDRRQREHRVNYPRMRNWRIVSRHTTKSAAQHAENQYRRRYGCAGNTGGGGAEHDSWVLYRFDY